MIEKTVFISYRRTYYTWALAIFQDLDHHGFDVFLDYRSLGPGVFEKSIFENITARAHFLVLLGPSALERCSEPSDLFRREIEAAINSSRNIIPIMVEGFDLSQFARKKKLTAALSELGRYQGVRIYPEFFKAAMEHLRNTYLNIPTTAEIHAPSEAAQEDAVQQKTAASAAKKVTEHDLAESYQQGVRAAKQAAEDDRNKGKELLSWTAPLTFLLFWAVAMSQNGGYFSLGTIALVSATVSLPLSVVGLLRWAGVVMGVYIPIAVLVAVLGFMGVAFWSSDHNQYPVTLVATIVVGLLAALLGITVMPSRRRSP
jgi:hypothetical protein